MAKEHVEGWVTENETELWNKMAKKYQFGQPFRKNWNFQQSELADNYGDSHMKESTDRNYKYLNFKEIFSVI